MEKFFLRTFLIDNKLDIVDEQNIDFAVFLAELRDRIIIFGSNGVDQFVREVLTGGI